MRAPRITAAAAVIVLAACAGSSGAAASTPQSLSAAIAPASAVRFPDGYPGDIYVGDTQVWPTSVPPTSTPATTSTTAAPTTSTTIAATTTTAAPTTTTTVAPTTSTTVAPTTSTTIPATSTTTAPAACPALTGAAFCATFSSTAGPVAGTRTGDLDPTIWGVSRINSAVNLGQGQYNPFLPASLLGATVTPPHDVKITGGQLYDAVTDGGNQTILAMYPKQPFDFAGRTGKIVFDVNADSDNGHAAWPEFWITDLPVPAPGPDAPGIHTYARNSWGFALDQQEGSYPCSGPTETGIGSVWRTANYVLQDVSWVNESCITKGDATHLNHFEIRMAANRVEIWGSDPGGVNLHRMAYSTDAMPLTRGVIWINDVHYNACKYDGTQCSHTFVWDNVAFDGPTPYRDLTFDVPDATDGQNLGYLIGSTARTFTVTGVNWAQTPTAAYVLLNWHPEASAEVPQVSVNGNPFIAMANPFGSDTYLWRTIAIAVPLAQVHTGSNTIAIKAGSDTVVANINLGLIAAAPVG